MLQPYFSLSVLASVFLLAAVLLQQRQIRAYRSRSIRVPVRRKESSFDALEQFPEALIVVSHAGSVLFRNSEWKGLSRPYDGVQNLAEFDQAAGTTLQKHLLERQGTARFELRLKVPGQAERLPYLALSWPLHSPDAVHGRVVTLFPQRLSRERRREFPRLELLLMEYLAGSSQELERLTRREATAEELESANIRSKAMIQTAHYVQRLHGPLRRHADVRRIEVLEPINQALREYRAALRNSGIRTVNMVGSQLRAMGNTDDLQILFGLLLEGAAAEASRGELRIDASKRGESLQIETRYPMQGANDDPLQAARYVLGRQFAAKLNGRLERSESGGERLVSLTLRAA